MARSPYFSTVHGYSPEQDLYNNLKREQIRLFGADFHYLPRLNDHIDWLFQESPVGTFEIATPITCYIESFEGYAAGGDILTKFNLRNTDELRVIISKTDFNIEITPVLREYFALKGVSVTDPSAACPIERPREGDLIYSFFDKGLFLIKFVEWRSPFYPMNTSDTFKLSLERFEYSGERINILINPIAEINNLISSTNFQRFSGTLQAGGTGYFQPNDLVHVHPNANNHTGGVTATLWAIHHTNLTFELGLLSDFSPDRADSATNDMRWTQFNGWYISNADLSVKHRITTVIKDDLVAEDNYDLQTEFDTIKVFDVVDKDEFGFF